MNIKQLPMDPLKVDNYLIKNLPQDIASASLMSDEDRLFLNGLVRLCRPKNIWR